jgi:hypothetical protein
MIDAGNFGAMEVVAYINVDTDEVHRSFPRTQPRRLPQILSERPLGYRYVVGSTFVGYAEYANDYRLVDLLDLKHDTELTKLWVGWNRTYTDLDAAIMAAMIRGNPS